MEGRSPGKAFNYLVNVKQTYPSSQLIPRCRCQWMLHTGAAYKENIND